MLLALPEAKQRVIVDTIVGRKLSVRETEELVKRTRTGKKTRNSEQSSSRETDPKLLQRLEKLLPFPHRLTRKGLEIRLPDEASLKAFIDFLDKNDR